MNRNHPEIEINQLFFAVCNNQLCSSIEKNFVYYGLCAATISMLGAFREEVIDATIQESGWTRSELVRPSGNAGGWVGLWWDKDLASS